MHYDRHLDSASSFDIRCSAACTRAGLCLLLLSAVAIAMLQPLLKAKQLYALQSYVVLRLQLKDTIDDLQAEARWQAVRRGSVGEEATKHWNLSVLMAAKFDVNGEPLDREPTPTDESDPSKLSVRVTVPTKKVHDENSGTWVFPTLEAPQLFLGFTQLADVADSVVALGNGRLLTRARAFSQSFGHSIYRWELLRYQLLTNQKGLWIKSKPKEPTKGTPSIKRDRLLRDLTLEEVTQLAQYDVPDAAEVDALWGEHNRLNLPRVGIPLDLAPGTIFVELALMFTIIYFLFYQREAQRSDNFPAPATVFGVFCRTRASRAVFSMLGYVPAIAAVLLAAFSLSRTYKILNSIIAGLILLLSIMITVSSRLGSPATQPESAKRADAHQ